MNLNYRLVSMLVPALIPVISPIQAAPLATPAASTERSVSGVALDASGKAVPGADVAVIDPNHFSRIIKSDSTGWFKLTGPWAQSGIAFMAGAGDLGTITPVSFSGQGIVELHLTSGSLCTFTGLVEDRSGNPIPSAPVELSVLGDASNVAHARTNSQGQFSFGSLIGGVRYTASVDMPGYSQGYSEITQTTPGSTIEMPTVYIDMADGYVGGTLLDAQSRPIENASIVDNDIKNTSTTTDYAGRFILKNIPRLQANLTIRTPSGSSITKFLASGTVSNIIRISPPTNGTVMDPDGKPEAGAIVTATLQDGGSETAVTDSLGQFVMKSPGLMPGDTVTARHGELATGEAFTYNGENLIPLSLAKGVSCTVTGQVLDMQGMPVAHANMQLILVNGNSFDNIGNTLSDTQGNYTFPPCSGNALYSVTAWLKGYAITHTDNVVFGGGRTFNMPVIKMKHADSFVGGTVLDPTGRPAPNVAVSDNDVFDIRTTTDQAGRFVLNGVPRESTTVMVQLSNGNIVSRHLTSGRADNIVYLDMPDPNLKQ